MRGRNTIAAASTIQKVTQDLDRLNFNTAISQLMILVNHLQTCETISQSTAKCFVKLLAPLAPHICEELWERLGETPSVCYAPWPTVDASKLDRSDVKIVFQVNGKFRGQSSISKTATEDEVLALAKEEPRVITQIEGKTIRKVFFVLEKLSISLLIDRSELPLDQSPPSAIDFLS